MKYEAIVIGVSSGGMQAMKIMFSLLPKNFNTPIIIVQHIGTSSNSQWIQLLNNQSNVFLKEADEKVLTEQLYKSLVSKYPNSYVYFEKYARFSQKNKNLEQALSLTNEAMKYPEGNIPQLKLLKSQILKELNKRDEATKEVNSALAAEDIQHKKYEKTYKKLNELKKELASLN